MAGPAKSLGTQHLPRAPVAPPSWSCWLATMEYFMCIAFYAAFPLKRLIILPKTPDLFSVPSADRNPMLATLLERLRPANPGLSCSQETTCLCNNKLQHLITETRSLLPAAGSIRARMTTYKPRTTTDQSMDWFYLCSKHWIKGLTSKF